MLLHKRKHTLTYTSLRYLVPPPAHFHREKRLTESESRIYAHFVSCLTPLLLMVCLCDEETLPFVVQSWVVYLGLDHPFVVLGAVEEP